MASRTSARAFAAFHRHDRTMIAGVVFVVWLAIVTGFGLDMVRRAHEGSLHFSLIVHLLDWGRFALRDDPAVKAVRMSLFRRMRLDGEWIVFGARS